MFDANDLLKMSANLLPPVKPGGKMSSNFFAGMDPNKKVHIRANVTALGETQQITPRNYTGDSNFFPFFFGYDEGV